MRRNPRSLECKTTFLPAKAVRHDAHAEGAHHAAHAEDGDGDAPDDGADPRGDGDAIALHPGVVEERSEFLVVEGETILRGKRTEVGTG